jgi:hypothetical protein
VSRASAAVKRDFSKIIETSCLVRDLRTHSELGERRRCTRLQPQLVGGCRAIVAREYLGDRDWSLRYANVVTRFGKSAEVVVACARTGGSGD